MVTDRWVLEFVLPAQVIHLYILLENILIRHQLCSNIIVIFDDDLL